MPTYVTVRVLEEEEEFLPAALHQVIIFFLLKRLIVSKLCEIMIGLAYLCGTRIVDI